MLNWLTGKIQNDLKDVHTYLACPHKLTTVATGTAPESILIEYSAKSCAASAGVQPSISHRRTRDTASEFLTCLIAAEHRLCGRAGYVCYFSTIGPMMCALASCSAFRISSVFKLEPPKLGHGGSCVIMEADARKRTTEVSLSRAHTPFVAFAT